MVIDQADILDLSVVPDYHPAGFDQNGSFHLIAPSTEKEAEMKTFEVLIRGEGGNTSTAIVHADHYVVESRGQVEGYLVFRKSTVSLPVAIFSPGWLCVTLTS